MPPDVLAASCHDLVQIYPTRHGPVPAIRGISTAFPVGSVTAIVGPSGAGKSTLLRLLACLEQPSAGDVVVDGTSTARLAGRARRRLIAKHIGFVFQRPSENLVDYLTVAEHLDLAWHMRTDAGGPVDDLLDAADLTSVSRLRPQELTAGEQQRLAFVAAVAGGPALVVADEPTAELDPRAAAAIARLLTALAHGGVTVVASSHDPAVTTIADQVLVIRNGTLAEQGPPGRLGVVLDDAGRIQLPDEARAQFRSGRVRIHPDDDGYRITRA
jgi:ABC-type lipoprotein export system ATPase subunit